jgi:hypothetical protein
MNDFRVLRGIKVTQEVVAFAKNLHKNPTWDLQLDPKMLEFVCMAKRRHVGDGFPCRVIQATYRTTHSGRKFPRLVSPPCVLLIGDFNMNTSCDP